MVGHLEGLEVFPCPAFRIPKIFDFGAARIDNGVSFTEDAGSDFVRLTLTLNQKSRMFF
jgi:hypothetical protein